MFAIRSGVASVSRLSGTVVRHYKVHAATPPTVKVSSAEKVFALFCLAGSILGLPMYMIPKFKEYGKK